MNSHSHNEQSAGPSMNAPTAKYCYPRQVATNQQGLNEHERKRNYPCKS